MIKLENFTVVSSTVAALFSSMLYFFALLSLTGVLSPTGIVPISVDGLGSIIAIISGILLGTVNFYCCSSLYEASVNNFERGLAITISIPIFIWLVKDDIG